MFLFHFGDKLTYCVDYLSHTDFGKSATVELIFRVKDTIVVGGPNKDGQMKR